MRTPFTASSLQSRSMSAQPRGGSSQRTPADIDREVAEHVVVSDRELVEPPVAANQCEIAALDRDLRLERLREPFLRLALLPAADRDAEHEQHDEPPDEHAGCHDRRAFQHTTMLPHGARGGSRIHSGRRGQTSRSPISAAFSVISLKRARDVLAHQVAR